MEDTGSYSTDELMDSLKRKKSVPKSQKWAEDEAASDRSRIDRDIERIYGSRRKFCDEAWISPSHLSEFISGKKKMSRDTLIRMFLCLNYDLMQVNSLLMHINCESLYVRNRRDYLIAECLNKHMNLYDAHETLRGEGFDGLMPGDE